MTDQFSIESFTSNVSVVYLNESYQSISITFTAQVIDSRWDPNTDIPQNTYLAQIDNTYTWSEAYSYSTYILAKNTASEQNVVLDSNNLGNTTYSIPGSTYTSGNTTFYTWTKVYNISTFEVGSTTDTLTLTVSDENNNTQTSSLEIVVIKVETCFKLNGSLNITKTGLHDVTNLLDTSVTYEVATTERVRYTDSLTFAYYIEAKYNINNEITYTASSSTDNLDDAYMFNGITVTNTNAIEPNLNLPTADNVSVDAGLIDALDPSSNSIGNFPVTLLLSVNNIGTLSGSISISGNDVIPNVSDNNLLVEYAYWPINSFTLPEINSNTADNLVPLKASNLTSHFSDDLDKILNYYHNVNVIDSWTITLNSIPSSSNNTLAKYARDVLNTGNSQVFSEGSKVVASSPFIYNISINDYRNNNVVIVPDTNVYGVIVQSS